MVLLVLALAFYFYIMSRHRDQVKRLFTVTVTNFQTNQSAVTKPLANPVTPTTIGTEDVRFDISRCQKWAVVAPLDTKWSSEAVHRQVRMHDWCLVIVLEKEPSDTYDTRWFEGEGNKAVVVLTPDNTKDIGDNEFVKASPWNYNGRKNIGYYYAITHGANTIWDFDDENMLKFWIPGAAPPGAPSIDGSLPEGDEDVDVDVLEPNAHKYPTWNPYPAMGAPALPSWPRGLPLDDAMNENCNNVELKSTTITKSSIAVLQSLSDHQPDADALYQAIMPFPLYFKKREMKPVMVPPFSMTPYNERATLHFKVGFWALFLPTTMERELSDIWRSYIAQRLFWEVGLRVGVTGRPLVVHDKNIHYSLDKTAIANSSSTIKKLITFLGSWRTKGNSFTECVDDLWLKLNQNSFVQHKDVELLHLWLKTLTRSGYKFVALQRTVTFSTVTVPYSTHKIDSEILNSTLVKLFPKEPRKLRYTVNKNHPECDDEVCHVDLHRESFTFWTSDIHFASQLDQPSFLGNLGQNVLVAIAHHGSFRNPFVWKMKGMRLYHGVSDMLKKYFYRVGCQNQRMTEEMIIDNFEFYKNDSGIASVDAFICLYQPGMCEMWMPFNKTIVFIPAHRYNLGRCTIEETKQLNKHLYTLAIMDYPKHVISASSKYDLEYIRHYTGLQVLPLYTYCLYVANNTYNPTRNEIVLFVRRAGYNNWDDRFKTEITKVQLVELKHYSFSDLVQYRAVVFLPYAVMTYKMTELYTMSIPMFVPSMKYFQNIKGFGPDRTVLAQYFCKFSGPLKDSEMVADPSSIHPYSPNAIDIESEFYWLQLSDFAQWPHITYFDDFKDLEEKLLTADFEKIHRLMVEENKRKRSELENNWCKIFKKMEKGRAVPKDYESAIRELYNVSRLQVY